MRTAAKINKMLEGLWTVHDMRREFGVCEMTLYNWRHTLALPVVVLPNRSKPAVRFVPEEIERWARQRGIEMRKKPPHVVRRKLLEAA